MEYFDLYNKDGQKINKQVLRGSKLLNDEYHLIVREMARVAKKELSPIKQNMSFG